MSWHSVGGRTFHAVFYSVWVLLSAVLGFLLLILAPVIHLAAYIAHGFLAPIYFLGRFETLYIYLGVAALIGLFTGSLLHLSSNVLIKALSLQASSEQPGRTAASVRAAREKRRLEDAWQASAPIRSNRPPTRGEEMSKDYSEYNEKDRSKRKEGQGLLSQIILEEDDDSEDEF